MKYRTMGKLGIQSSVFGLGCMRFNGEASGSSVIDFEAVQASHVRVIITSNTAAPAHAKGAQVAEICIYGE